MSLTALDSAATNRAVDEAKNGVKEANRLVVAGRPAEAIALATECWALIEHLDEPLHQAECQRALGWAYQSTGDMKESLRACYRSVDLYHAAGEPAGAARTLSLGAIALVRLGDTEEALSTLARAWALVERSDDPATKARIWVNMSVVHDELEDFDQAVAASEMALRFGTEANDAVPVARASANLQVYRVQQALKAHRRDATEANKHSLLARMAEARQFTDACADLIMKTSLLSALGKAHLALGQLEATRAALAQALDIAKNTGDHFEGPAILMTLAELESQAGNRAAAHDHLCAALRLSEEQGRLDNVAQCRLRLSQLHESAGDLAGALRQYRSYHETELAVLRAQASTRAQVLAIRLDSERSRLETELFQLRAAQLEQENIHLQSRAEQLDRDANEDSLTGLGNRRFFEQAIKRTFDAGTAASGVVLGIADIDFFKQVNDRFSHATGDRVLQQIGALFKRHCRQHDLIARFGGEEFVVAFVQASPGEAHDAAERLRQAIARFDWGSIQPDLQVTISVGLATCLTAQGVDDALKEADTALYAAKHAGRNRVHPPKAG